MLWLGIATLLAASGNPRARRAAVRGLGSIAVTSLLANQAGKRIVPRHRPSLALVPAGRIARRVPTSSSFPSGHSASAAAFAVGASAECPPLGLPLGALAAAVAYSRVHTGVHFPSDAVAGVLLGAAIAGAGTVAVRGHHDEPARAGDEPSRPQPPRPTGRGVIAVVNPDSGGGDGEDAIELLKRRLPDAEVLALGEDDDIADVMRDAASRADVLAVGGGDGTVNAAAVAAMAADIPLLVLPAGTFNHFAKDAGLPTLDDAVRALARGRAARIDVGDIDGLLFLNTASLGSYPEFVKHRERWESRLGKPLAAAVAIVTVLRSCPPLAAELDGVRRELVMLFVGNGLYSPHGYLPRRRARLDTGQLDVRFVDAAKRTARVGLIAGTLTGDLFHTSRYVQTRQGELSVRITGADAGYLARDGEITAAPRSAHFTVRRQALTVYVGEPAGRG